MAAGIGFGLMGLAAYIKTNLESKKQEKELELENAPNEKARMVDSDGKTHIIS